MENLQAIMASQRNKRTSGKFFVTRGPFLASCKTPLTRKALSCLYFRKTKPEEHIVSDLFGYTGRPNCKATNVSVPGCLCCSLHLERNFHRRLLNSGDQLQWRCFNKDLVMVLSNLHTNRNELKGSEEFN